MCRTQVLIDHTDFKQSDTLDAVIACWVDCQDAEGYDTQGIIESLEFVQSQGDPDASPSKWAIFQKHIDNLRQFIE